MNQPSLPGVQEVLVVHFLLSHQVAHCLLFSLQDLEDQLDQASLDPPKTQ